MRIELKFGVIDICLGLLGYVLFPENLRENARERKYKGKVEEKKKWRKIKNRLKVDKLIFLLLQTHFIYFNSSI